MSSLIVRHNLRTVGLFLVVLSFAPAAKGIKMFNLIIPRGSIVPTFLFCLSFLPMGKPATAQNTCVWLANCYFARIVEPSREECMSKTLAIRAEEDVMNTKHGNRGLQATRNQNSAGCHFKLGFLLQR